MPAIPVPEKFNGLLANPKALGHFATISAANGRPQVNPVWFLWDAEHQQILMSVRGETAKLRNLRANPHIAMSVLDPTDSGKYVELRGTVMALELYTTLEFVNLLAKKYTDKGFDPSSAGDERYKVTIQVENWTG